MNTASDRLLIAVPSKGRLQENAAAFFGRAGLNLRQGRGNRDYRGTLDGLPNAEVVFLSASEIAAQLASGQVHLGVTGEDLIRESVPDADERLCLLAPLGFGQANVVVAVPQGWIDVRSMADLEDVAAAFHAKYGRRMRVATKYVNLTRGFFAQHGVSDYRIVESLGATEGAPASGAAELIVDITTTGATLTANALKVLDDGLMLESEANLVASLTARWTPAAQEAARRMLVRIAAEETARLSRLVSADFGQLPTDLDDVVGRFGAERRSGSAACEWICPAGNAAELAQWLLERGADPVAVTRADYVFRRDNPVAERLIARLDTARLHEPA